MRMTVMMRVCVVVFQEKLEQQKRQREQQQAMLQRERGGMIGPPRPGVPPGMVPPGMPPGMVPRMEGPPQR